MNAYKTKLVVFGSRTIYDYKRIYLELDKLVDPIPKGELLLIVGGAKGPDDIGMFYAIEHRLPFMLCKPDWDQYKKAAGHIRNRQMAEEATRGLGFWDKVSPGTEGMADTMFSLHKRTKVLNLPKSTEEERLSWETVKQQLISSLPTWNELYRVDIIDPFTKIYSPR